MEVIERIVETCCQILQVGLMSIGIYTLIGDIVPIPTVISIALAIALYFYGLHYQSKAVTKIINKRRQTTP